MKGITSRGSDEEPRDYNVKVTVRNGRLLSRLRAAGYPSVLAFCRAHGLTQSAIQRIVNLRESGMTSKDRWRKSVTLVSDILKCMPEDIVPVQHWRSGLKKNTAEIEMTEDQVAGLIMGENPSPEEYLLSNEMADILRGVLDELPPRENRLLRMRYGIDCEPYTAEECAELYGVTTSRVHQLELKALRKMNHPARSKRLEPYRT